MQLLRLHEAAFDEIYYRALHWQSDSAVSEAAVAPLSASGSSRNRSRISRLHRLEKPELWTAVSIGDTARIYRLLKEGHNVNARYKDWTPLMKAADRGRLGDVDLLMSAKANVHERSNRGRTALSFAANPVRNRIIKESHVVVLKWLLDARADVFDKDESGRTAKELAERDRGWQDTVAYLDRVEAERRQRPRLPTPPPPPRRQAPRQAPWHPQTPPPPIRPPPRPTTRC